MKRERIQCVAKTNAVMIEVLLKGVVV